MNRWWWLVLILQVTSYKVLAEGEGTTARGESACGESGCKNWSQESEIVGENVVKRQPLLSRWGGQRLSDLFYFDYKRRPAFSSWGGKRGPAFSSWGGKRSIQQHTHSNDSASSTAWTSPDDLVANRHQAMETGDKLDQINDEWNDNESRKLHSYSTQQKNILVPLSSWRENIFEHFEPTRDAYLEYTPFKEDEYDPRSTSRYGIENIVEPDDKFGSFDGKRAPEFYDLDENKRAAAFNSWGGKRAAAFNSWGGKRTSELYDSSEDKRAAAFNSWGGKRAAAFNSWGGKRAPEFYDLDEDKRAAAFNSWGGKRAAAFNSWGGKRAPEFYYLDGDKRTAAFNSWGGKRAAAFNSWGGKRAAAFNSWGGKRAAAFNSWGGKRTPEFYDLDEDKRAAAFNSWGGKRAPEFYDLDEDKRAAAFNSWGGKRAAAFNSWGGKRAPEFYYLDGDKRTAAFNSWGGKRAAAFNSWGGKRAAAFNSWGGKRTPEFYDLDNYKRAAAFNSWGGKRAPAFNSWGGKRSTTAFSSWGGKRNAAFNSWGGKRSDTREQGSELMNSEFPNRDQTSTNNRNHTQQNTLKSDGSDPTAKQSSSLENIISAYNDEIVNNEKDAQNIENESSSREKRKRLTIKAGKRKPRFHSWGGKKRSESEPDEYDEEISSDEDYADDTFEQIQDENEIEDDNSMIGEILSDKNIGKRIDELFPTNSRSGFSGKRKPAFSSWGGKRSDPEGNYDEDKNENKSRRKRNIIDENLSNDVWGVASNDIIDNSLFPTNTVTCCVKKLQYGNRNLFMQMLFRTNGFRDLSWPSIRPNRRGADFYAWGGKRTTL